KEPREPPRPTVDRSSQAPSALDQLPTVSLNRFPDPDPPPEPGHPAQSQPNTNGRTVIGPSPRRHAVGRPRYKASSCLSCAMTVRMMVTPSPLSQGARTV